MPKDRRLEYMAIITEEKKKHKLEISRHRANPEVTAYALNMITNNSLSKRQTHSELMKDQIL